MVYSILGGDKRQIYLAEYLQKSGNTVKLFANNALDLSAFNCAEALTDTLEHTDILLLPLPCSKNGVTLNAPFYEKKIELQDIIANCPKKVIILGGKLPTPFVTAAATKGIVAVDYANDEALQIANAIPTAEEAIKIAIENTETTLYSSNILITGFGRIGKILARYLRALGASVTVSARKESDIAWIKAEGFTPIYTSKINTVLAKTDIVFNTVPFIIFKENELQSCSKHTLLIDLASGGGIDFAAAERLQLKAVHALSLPGKTAPKTSAYILYQTIKNITNKIHTHEERSSI